MGAHHPFRFGLNTSASSRKAWSETARKAEALGYDTLLLSDHLDTSLAPVPALVAAADATTTLRVGSYVFGNDFRHPVFLAQEAATIDLLSDGRFDFGLGTGYMAGDYTQSGIRLDPPGVRVSRLEEAVKVVKGYFAEDDFTFSGEYYQVRDLKTGTKPVQRPHPPIMLGGGSRRTLSLAAREADIVSVNIKTTVDGGFDFSSVTARAAREKLEWVRQAAGTRFDELTLNILVPVVSVTDEPRQAAETALRAWNIPESELNVDELLESPSALIGTVDQIVDMLELRREQYGFSYIAVWGPMEDFAPVVQRLSGR